MKEKVHKHGGAPYYGQADAVNQHSLTQDADKASHRVDKTKNIGSATYVIDIETTTETPITPMFGVGLTTGDQSDEDTYDFLINVGFEPDMCEALVVPSHQDEVAEKLRKDYIESSVDEELWGEHHGRQPNIKVNFVVGVENWLEDILDDIRTHNNGGSMGDKYLVAHNAMFDLLQSGSTYDDIRKERDVIGTDDDGVVYVGDYIIRHKSAGAHGRIYDIQHKSVSASKVKIPIVDTLTVAKSTWTATKLSDLADYYDIDKQFDGEDEEYGTYSQQHVRYCLSDVITTDMVYAEQSKNLRENMDIIHPSQIYSSASIGKYMLSQKDYDRTRTKKEDAEILMSSYLGGQTWLSDSKKIHEDITMVDIMSQYPSMSALGNLWELMVGDEIWLKELPHETEYRIEENAFEDGEFVGEKEVEKTFSDLHGNRYTTIEDLPNPTKEDLVDPNTWEDISTIFVEISCENAKLPVRIDKDEDKTTRIEWANMTTDDDETVIYHYADIISARLLRCGNITIENAWVVDVKRDMNNGRNSPMGSDPIEIGGQVISGNDNVMRRTIENRKEIQKEVGGKNERTKANKVIANSIYGCTAERIENEIISGNQHGMTRTRNDIAGDYYNPAFASAITALGRLSLSYGRAWAQECGADAVYCDTDSLVLGSGENMSSGKVAEVVIDKFSRLNPYKYGPATQQNMLEIETWEDDNDNKHEITGSNYSIFTLGVKKYAIMKDSEIVKWTEHGMGHFNQLREDEPQKELWKMVMNLTTDMDYDLDDDVLNTRLSISQQITTHNTREIVMNQLDENVGYGDFFDLIVSTGSETVLNLDQSDDEDMPQVVVIGDDGVEEKPLYEIEMKTIRDVAYEWAVSTYTSGHPDITIVDTKTVNKENYELVSHITDDLIEKYQQLIN